VVVVLAGCSTVVDSVVVLVVRVGGWSCAQEASASAPAIAMIGRIDLIITAGGYLCSVVVVVVVVFFSSMAGGVSAVRTLLTTTFEAIRSSPCLT
jgi:hypothetical protein